MPNRPSKKKPLKRGLVKHSLDRFNPNDDYNKLRSERFSACTCVNSLVLPKEIEVMLRDYESLGKSMHDEMRMHFLNSYSRLRKVIQSEEELILQRLETCREGLLSKMEEIRGLLKENRVTDSYAVFANAETENGGDHEDKDGDHEDKDGDHSQFTITGSRESRNTFCVPRDESPASTDSPKTIRSARSEKGGDACADVLEPLNKSVEDPRVHSVRLSHFVDPDELFVISTVHLTQREDLERKMSHLKAPHAPQEVIRGENKTPSPTEGKMYLMKNASTDFWHRVRVVSNAAEKENVATVYLVDYGHTKTVSVTGLMSIPEEFAKAPPMALKCRLFECVPRGKNWSKDAMAFMNNLIGYDATMVVGRRCLDCLEVDLRDLHSTTSPGVRIKSLCRELTFFEARDSAGFDHNAQLTPTPRPDFPAPRLPSSGQSLDVVVTHLRFPTCFYVQQVNLSSHHLLKMSTTLDRLYNYQTHKGILYNPRAGMPCAAVFPSDGKWYRARILEVFKRNNIRIEYVDYGNEETVNWLSVRRLRRELLALPPLAFRCVLAEDGNDTATWNRLREGETKRSLLHLTVAGVTGSNSLTLKVKMQAKKEEKEDDDAWDPPTAEDGSEGSNSTVTPECGTPHINDYPNRGKDNEETSGFLEVVQKSVGVDHNEPHSGCSAKDGAFQPLAEKPRTEANQEESSVFRPKVEIVWVNSPSSIYVTFPELASELSKLQSKLNNVYENSSPDEDKKWEENEKCAVLRSETKNWCRAHIVKLLSNSKVQVFLKDMGALAIEPLSSLRTLKDPFLTFATYTFKCHLCDVCPAGTSWPDVTCEFLSNEIETHEHVYMTKKGEIVDASLPVELWIKKKASEPSASAEAFTDEWVSLNRLLVNEGLALPIIRNFSWFSSAQNKSEAVDPVIGDHFGPDSLNLERAGISSAWLPPVPLDRTVFVGVPTFVDSDAVIHLYDEQNDLKLRDIKNVLWDTYGSAESDEVELCHWSPGAACIARYHIDGGWYRGKVLKTNQDCTIDVVFVDYGNMENCQAQDVRMCLANVTTEKPILSHKVVLKGIAPASECCSWSDADIDFLHYTVVDKKCEVTVWQASSDPSEPSTVSDSVIIRRPLI